MYSTVVILGGGGSKLNTVKPVLSDTCMIRFPVLSDIDLHTLLTILYVFYTVKSDTQSILTPFSHSFSQIKQVLL